MLQTIIQNIIRFIVLVLVQVLVLNHIQFLGFINPYIYILFILSLPVKTDRWIILLLSFVLGITVDSFADTLGLHAFACVLTGFLRDPLIKLLSATEENPGATPSFTSFGASMYVKYVVMLTLVHHMTIFFLDAFSFTNFTGTLFRAVASTAISTLFILGIQLLKKH